MIMLDEFRKPYEYEEDTGVIWPIRIFCMLLLSVEAFLSVICIFQLNEFLVSIPLARIIARVLTLVFLVYILVTIVFLFKLERHALIIAKSYLISRLFYLIPSISVIFSYIINDKNSIGAGYGKFESVNDIIAMVLVTPLIYILLFSISWYIYFNKSKRVKEAYEET